MKLKTYQYRDPGQVVLDVMRRRPLIAGDVVLALVRQPSTEQEVVTVRPLPPERWQGLDRHDLSQLLAQEAEALPVPTWATGQPPQHSIVTLVARSGWCLVGRADAKWMIAWMYSNHLMHTFASELIVVTEHGWTDFTTGWGGYEPRLRAA
jgi:hypothetical protein